MPNLELHYTPESENGTQEVRNKLGQVVALIGVDRSVKFPPVENPEQEEGEDK